MVVSLKQANINIWNWAIIVIFYFAKSFLNIFFFLIPSFSKFGTGGCPPSRKSGGCWYCADLFNWSGNKYCDKWTSVLGDFYSIVLLSICNFIAGDTVWRSVSSFLHILLTFLVEDSLRKSNTMFIFLFLQCFSALLIEYFGVTVIF